MPSKRNRLIALGIVLIVFSTVIGGILAYHLSGSPQPVTIAQINDALLSHELQPVDITENAQGNFPNAGLLDCIVAEQEDIRFEFYNFDNAESAYKVYQEARKIIVQKPVGGLKIRIRDSKLNYKYYSLTLDESYAVAVCVENTAVYAYCARDNQSKIIGVLDTLGYVDAEPKQDLPEWTASLMRILIFAFITLIIGLPGRSFLWRAACLSAGVTQKQIEDMEQPKKELSRWLIEVSPRTKQTKNILTAYKWYLLPGYAFIALSILGFFSAELGEVINTAGVYLPLIFIAMLLISKRFSKHLKKKLEVSQ